MQFASITALAMVTALAAAIPAPQAADSPPALTATRTFTCTNDKTKGYNCPAKGRLTSPMVIGFESGIANLNACRDICLSHDECITFKWVVSGGQCTQYSTTLPKMGLVFDDSAVGDMYNRNCFVCDAGTPISTSSSSAAPSTTATSTSTSTRPATTSSSSSTSTSATQASSSSVAPASSSTSSSSSTSTTSASSSSAASSLVTSTSASQASSSSAASSTITTSTITGSEAPYAVTLITETICPTPSTSSIVATTPVVESSSSSSSSQTSSTTSQTPVASSPAPSPCANRGLAWAEYRSDAGDNTDATYSAFDPTFFKNRTPGCSGATTTIAGFSAPSVRNGAFSVYGSSCTFDSEYFVLDHVGYFYAPLTGTYNITISNADDAVFLWVDGRDGKTVSGWNRGNADAITNKNSNTASLTQVTAIAGSYTPIRIMYAQAQGVGGFGVSIFDPAGNELLASRQDSSAYIVQYGCGTDATAAPQFAPWGMES